MDRVDVVSAVREQARACADLGSPMYADLLTRIAADIEGGGVFSRLLAGHENDPGPSALALRLLGSVHRLVLDGDAPELAAFYPTVGGAWRPDAGWRALVQTVREHPVAVRDRIRHPPQTNEVGRAAALMGGLLHVVAEHPLPVRLFETGASAGLNLRADQFCYHDGTHRYGRVDSPVQLRGAWAGRRLPAHAPRVVDRLGCDVAPVDVSTQEGRSTLMSYVWPDQPERWRRLLDAFAVAEEMPASVRRQDARGFVDELSLADGTTTVLWHSLMWQYLERDDQDAITARLADLGGQATSRRALAHLLLEPVRRTPDTAHEFLVVLRTWPGGAPRVLGAAAPHGVPTVWE